MKTILKCCNKPMEFEIVGAGIHYNCKCGNKFSFQTVINMLHRYWEDIGFTSRVFHPDGLARNIAPRTFIRSQELRSTLNACLEKNGWSTTGIQPWEEWQYIWERLTETQIEYLFQKYVGVIAKNPNE